MAFQKPEPGPSTAPAPSFQQSRSSPPPKIARVSFESTSTA